MNRIAFLWVLILPICITSLPYYCLTILSMMLFKPKPDKPGLNIEDLWYRFAMSFIQSGYRINHA